VLRALDPRVVHLTAEPHERVILDALAALAALRRPVVVGIAAENRVTLPDGPRGRTILQLWRRFDAIAAAGTATVVSFRAAGLPDRVVTEVLGLPVADPEPGSRASRPGRPLRVGYVGRLVPEKGVEELVGAVASIDGVELVLAGPGPLEDALRRRAATDLEGRIELLGLIDRPTLWKVLRGIDVLALLSRSTPGWSEQFGFVLAEAMAVGTPVLGSTSGAIPEVVGDAGLVVDEGSTQAAADALQRLRDDPGLRSRLAENARARYLAEYSVEAYGRKLAGVIAGRLNERQRRS
jgi:glycosyltransferase involved in cell wall biosynthesis